ncbi:hypothetical protein Tco_0090139 [Tanacetum coccineum]
MPPKSAPLTQASIRRMIKESVDAAIAVERARHANARNDQEDLDHVSVKMSHTAVRTNELRNGKKDTVTAARRTLQRTCLDLVNAVSKTGNPNGRPPLD